MTAWLKYYYPVEFFASAMNFVGKIDELPSLIADAKRHNIRVLPPDVNKSEANFSTEKGAIRFGLAFLRGAKSRAQAVIDARESGFASFRDFIASKPGKAMAEALILSGACDRFGGVDMRASLLTAYEELDALLTKIQNAQDKLDAIEDPNSPKAIEARNNLDTLMAQWKNAKPPVARKMSLMERLNKELQYTSVYFSGNPLDHYIVTKDIEPIDSLVENETKWIAGTISETNVMKTKKGARQMMSGKITDNSSTISFIMFPQVYEQVADKLDNVMAFNGYMQQKDNEEMQFVVNDVKTLPEKKKRMTIWYKDYEKELAIVKKGNVSSDKGYPVAFSARGKKMIQTDYHITEEYAKANGLDYSTIL